MNTEKIFNNSRQLMSLEEFNKRDFLSYPNEIILTSNNYQRTNKDYNYRFNFIIDQTTKLIKNSNVINYINLDDKDSYTLDQLNQLVILFTEYSFEIKLEIIDSYNEPSYLNPKFETYYKIKYEVNKWKKINYFTEDRKKSISYSNHVNTLDDFETKINYTKQNKKQIKLKCERFLINLAIRGFNEYFTHENLTTNLNFNCYSDKLFNMRYNKLNEVLKQ